MQRLTAVGADILLGRDALWAVDPGVQGRFPSIQCGVFIIFARLCRKTSAAKGKYG
jgi:hypothetical protein